MKAALEKRHVTSKRKKENDVKSRFLNNDNGNQKAVEYYLQINKIMVNMYGQ